MFLACVNNIYSYIFTITTGSVYVTICLILAQT